VLKACINGKCGWSSFEVWCPIPALWSIPVIACSHDVEFCSVCQRRAGGGEGRRNVKPVFCISCGITFRACLGQKVNRRCVGNWRPCLRFVIDCLTRAGSGSWREKLWSMIVIVFNLYDSTSGWTATCSLSHDNHSYRWIFSRITSWMQIVRVYEYVYEYNILLEYTAHQHCM